MIKSWYLSVREETMAPARMVSFMEQHATTCEICLQDPTLKNEIAKITELILPESKIPKAVRQQSGVDDDSTFEDDSTIEDGEDDSTSLDDGDDDIEDIDSEEEEEDEFLEESDEDED